MSTQPHQPPAEPVSQEGLRFAREYQFLRPSGGLARAFDAATAELRKELEQVKVALEREVDSHAFDLSPAMVQARNDQLNAELEAERAKYTEAVYAMTKYQNERDALLAELEQARAQLAESEAKLTTILEDADYKGGVQYWIRKHDEIMLLATRIAAESVTATADRDAQAALAGELRGALVTVLNTPESKRNGFANLSTQRWISKRISEALAMEPSSTLAGRLEAFKEGCIVCNGAGPMNEDEISLAWEQSETRKGLVP